jgi:serine/threonine-protein kinase HipA
MATAEAATLRLAARCGLTVPATRVVDLGGKNCMLIRRFDRYWITSAQLAAGAAYLPADLVLHETPAHAQAIELRLPFISALTLVGCHEREAHVQSYANIAAAVRRHAHPAAIRADNRELFARMVFNILVSNDDDHLRNHGFVLDPRMGGWRLSPLYDVVPRPGVAFDRFLQLNVGPQGKVATLDNALAAHVAFDLERPAAVALISRVARETGRWREHFEDGNVPGGLIDRLAGAFRQLDDVASADLRDELRIAPFGVAGG